ncbi:NADP-dependent phosphogluconate dehydrogenase [uncultured Dialister sp.]|uniref:NADP-dependent phosphogluconate dehydrogenase n=1 Tax=uncultured Dialister sp. TaxID=278064 RepID=UPI0025FBE7E1|nr:NADP-dependent phosphogluconate dehydrogenase [uncultured Dialister sp.]
MYKSQFGLIGLAVMGANLARNMASKGVKTLVYNRTAAKTKKFLEDFGDSPNLCGVFTLKDFVSQLEKPRKIILLIKAGKPVDDMLDELIPLLDQGDIIIDGGNSFFKDTQRRSHKMESLGFEYVGMGVSGGEEGALHGPSLMPGCSKGAYEQIQPVLDAISAKAEGEPCVDYIGTDGAGHYVKMVHNGIEYADMQLISEVYTIMRHVLNMSVEDIAEVFDKWNQGRLSSYLIEITASILKKKDVETGKPIVDIILDKAGQKGTGKWTSLSALELGVPTPTMTEAVFARDMSSMKEERVELDKKYNDIRFASDTLDKDSLLADLEKTLYASKICAYAQGFNLIGTAGEVYGWHLNLGHLAKIWRNGCIIRAAFLNVVSDSFDSNPSMKNLLFSDFFASALKEARPGWGRIVSLAAEAGVGIPALSSALAYFDAYHTPVGNANIIQAQRDYFGAHTYERVDKEGHFHTDWLN